MNISIREMSQIIHWQISQNMSADFLHGIFQEMLDRIDIDNDSSDATNRNLDKKRDLPKEISFLE